ncbi:type I-F CRISPR-associated helicase Cas3f [Thermithiobacillus tepidarius DSM 3134]|uniref:type I-F CRISPR-associated helicase Cas3f n=1 Tax=Thermithiobacillus tepidarius TaxID=929 RepID=UPI0004084F4A|nr:type I-F CRISPR-associated helicase Cas3f [Thermithiobacillus tepidarius]
MHVVLISACRKNAIKRTRAVLDRYASRMGDFTWATPITKEGLHSLRKQLRASASRNTAVLCLRSEGYHRLVPIWVVGARDRFGPDWRTPVFTTVRPTRLRTVDKTSAPWIVHAKQIAAISGLFHDLGKNNQFFATKLLRARPVADPIRHEWISTCLVDVLLESPGTALSDAWGAALERAKDIRRFPQSVALLPKGVLGPTEAVLACVATHHRLFGEYKNSGLIGPQAFLRDPDKLRQDAEKADAIPGSLNEQMVRSYPKGTEDDLKKALSRLDVLQSAEQSPNYWRALALIARCALILADHKVSSVQCQEVDTCEDAKRQNPFGPFANSAPGPQGKRVYNQTLQWHLQSVGQEAAAMLDRILRLPAQLPGLDPISLEQIDSDAFGQFAWQQQAAEAVASMREQHPGTPMLLAVIAGTGSGKTRACARLAVRAAQREEVRFATLLNLRTLTLQTGDAYAKQLGIDPDDLAVVIGDVMTRRAFEATREPELLNEDEMDRSLGEETEVSGWNDPLPDWLEHFVGSNSNLRAMIGAPVFVATADYMVPAGEPGAQGRHIMPLLRLMSSDLLLDEIDNYDATSIVAILRLVQLAGLFGRNVIASSATLTPVLASKLVQFYEHGTLMRAALHGKDQPDFICGTISNWAPPNLSVFSSSDHFAEEFKAHVGQVCASLQNTKTRPRKPGLIEFDKAEHAFFDAISREVLALHTTNAWTDPETGKRLSVGLVRVANIHTAVRVAQHLRRAQLLSTLRPKVACYHSQIFHGHRMLLEMALDHMLSRGNNAHAPAKHASVRAQLERSDVDEGLFIVVATPVEEVGRDHDFDWSLIEPSSAQSIVQTAGRVRRHRYSDSPGINVGILQFNLRACQGKSVAFQYPGNESGEFAYGTHDLKKLLDWEALENGLDSRLRFEPSRHALSEKDDAALEEQLKVPAHRMLHDKNLWLSSSTYQGWPLREQKPSETWRYDPESAGWLKLEKLQDGKWAFLPAAADAINTDWSFGTAHWLCPTASEIVEFCELHDLSANWAFEIDLFESQGKRLSFSIDGLLVDKEI